MIADSRDDPPMTQERLETVMKEEREKYLLGTKVIDRSGVTNINRVFDLKDFHLKKGKYYCK